MHNHKYRSWVVFCGWGGVEGEGGKGGGGDGM